MSSTHRPHHIFSYLAYCLLVLLLTACTSNTTLLTKNVTPTPGITLPLNRGGPPIVATTTSAMPPTQTSCPATGTARAMKTAPLASGQHQNIIYTLNEGAYDDPSQGKLMRYDVQTGQTIELLNVTNANFYEAQVSTDGQWVLFVTTTGSEGRITRLQAIRMDGQGLQTLTCAPGYGIQQMQWSADQQLLAFYNVVNGQGVVYLLNMTNGKLETLLTTPAGVGLILRTWLDTTHIYLTDTAQDTLFSHIYLLDIRRGPHQHLSDLLTMLLRQYGDFDSSYDGSHLFISYGGCPQGFCSGPSSIAAQSITGGRQQVIYTSQKYDVIAVRVIDQKSILFIISNTFSSTSLIEDASHNGLWRINLDGSGLTRLVPISKQQYTFLNYGTQDLWSNVSRDASMYVLQVDGFQGVVETDALLVGTVRGGKPKVFASISGTPQLAVVGWTTM